MEKYTPLFENVNTQKPMEFINDALLVERIGNSNVFQLTGSYLLDELRDQHLSKLIEYNDNLSTKTRYEFDWTK